MIDKPRCAWVTDDALYLAYHDQEWGVPQYDDRTLFEMLVLEGAQAGLSWLTVLRKRHSYRQAFANFQIASVASLSAAELMAAPGIIHHAGKLQSAITNAQAALSIQRDWGSLSNFLWAIVGGQPIVHQYLRGHQLPSQTEESQAMSRALKGYGMTFVGPTICYSFMQAIGMVNDHLTDCYRFRELRS
ncbi:MAG: DNA-3-methyladenine glycosylase I [Sulfobacillus benefaciens]|uniref:DNA-3-methyladenine glycosylase I n=1 Tax=Sulfobacillus benefaciens TaxID=453960 RepID=A0A2T2XG19_9FIRM|nr:MAG: DNA-3-methyladenine glycosylase I [Sulfobacillus benefaciens]